MGLAVPSLSLISYCIVYTCAFYNKMNQNNECANILFYKQNEHERKQVPAQNQNQNKIIINYENDSRHKNDNASADLNLEVNKKVCVKSDSKVEVPKGI